MSFNITEIVYGTLNTGAKVPFRPSMTTKGQPCLTVLHRTKTNDLVYRPAGATVELDQLGVKKDVTKELRSITFDNGTTLAFKVGETQTGNPKVSTDGHVKVDGYDIYLQISQASKGQVIGSIFPPKAPKAKPAPKAKVEHKYTF